jgi:hypothetical protein
MPRVPGHLWLSFIYSCINDFMISCLGHTGYGRGHFQVPRARTYKPAAGYRQRFLLTIGGLPFNIREIMK